MMPRNISIYPAVNGYVVHVGCAMFVFRGGDEMLTELREYLQDPEGVEQSYRERFPGLLGPPGLAGAMGGATTAYPLPESYQSPVSPLRGL